MLEIPTSAEIDILHVFLFPPKLAVCQAKEGKNGAILGNYGGEAKKGSFFLTAVMSGCRKLVENTNKPGW
jgi:hypothetical protein